MIKAAKKARYKIYFECTPNDYEQHSSDDFEAIAKEFCNRNLAWDSFGEYEVIIFDEQCQMEACRVEVEVGQRPIAINATIIPAVKQV